MGLLDLPAPVLGEIDVYLDAVIPAWGRLALWALLAAALSMTLYALLSSQHKLARLKAESARTRKTLADYDGDFGGLWPLVRQALSLSARQIGLAGWPAVVASLPILFLLAWLSTAFDYRLPQPGEIVQVRAVPQSAGLAWDGPARPAAEPGAWQLRWPGRDEGVRLLDATGSAVADLPLAAPVPVVHKRQWWNWLIGNPAGYLPDAAPLERIEIDLPRNAYLGFGPDWMRSWEVLFLTVLLASSIAIKIVFRIQ